MAGSSESGWLPTSMMSTIAMTIAHTPRASRARRSTMLRTPAISTRPISSATTARPDDDLAVDAGLPPGDGLDVGPHPLGERADHQEDGAEEGEQPAERVALLLGRRRGVLRGLRARARRAALLLRLLPGRGGVAGAAASSARGGCGRRAGRLRRWAGARPGLLGGCGAAAARPAAVGRRGPGRCGGLGRWELRGRRHGLGVGLGRGSRPGLRSRRSCRTGPRRARSSRSWCRCARARGLLDQGRWGHPSSRMPSPRARSPAAACSR